jgi:hypothetical protein
MNYLLALANFVVCGVALWSCLCRLNATSAGRVRMTVRIEYTVLLAGSVASGFSPILFNEWPGISQVLLGSAVLMMLLAEAHRWRDGAPPDVLSQPEPLGLPELDSVSGGKS